MKKFAKLVAVLTALVLGLACFAACSNGNDDGGSSNNGGNVSNNGGGNSNNGNANNNEEEETTPKVTVVAKYEMKGTPSCYYIFYSDKTYKYIERGTPWEEGTYYNTPTKTTTIAFEMKKEWNDAANTTISSSGSYEREIKKDQNGDLYFWDSYYSSYFYLSD